MVTNSNRKTSPPSPVTLSPCHRVTLSSSLAPYLFVLPFVLLFAVFMLYPLERSLTLSLQQTVGPRTTRFVGLRNYSFFLHDLLFWVAVGNTIAFTLAFLILQIPLSLGWDWPCCSTTRACGGAISSALLFFPRIWSATSSWPSSS
jgi:ABC-type sugar transport system permease subunit